MFYNYYNCSFLLTTKFTSSTTKIRQTVHHTRKSASRCAVIMPLHTTWRMCQWMMGRRGFSIISRQCLASPALRVQPRTVRPMGSQDPIRSQSHTVSSRFTRYGRDRLETLQKMGLARLRIVDLTLSESGILILIRIKPFKKCELGMGIQRITGPG